MKHVLTRKRKKNRRKFRIPITQNSKEGLQDAHRVVSPDLCLASAMGRACDRTRRHVTSQNNNNFGTKRRKRDKANQRESDGWFRAQEGYRLKNNTTAERPKAFCKDSGGINGTRGEKNH